MLIKFIERRIADKRVVRHIKKWLDAGVLEDGKRIQVRKGTPQGGSISPLLANIYLHYVFDLWAHEWRQRYANGAVIVVRYADDIVVGFGYLDDAERFQNDLQKRFARAGLELHPDKTRLIEFGRHAAKKRKRRGERKPETFDFLGFTHICSRTKGGRFMVRRKTQRKKMLAKLESLKRDLRRRMHGPVEKVGAWLRSVLRGYYNYYAVPGNSKTLSAFSYRIVLMWKHVLSRRSDRGRVTWERMTRIAAKWLPSPRILHPLPSQRLGVTTRGRSLVR